MALVLYYEKKAINSAVSSTRNMLLLFIGMMLVAWYTTGSVKSARSAVSSETRATSYSSSVASSSSMLPKHYQDPSRQKKATRTKVNPHFVSSSSSLKTCEPQQSSSPSYPRTPLIVFALERTGSNLFFDLIKKVNHHADNRAETDLLPLYELYMNSTIQEPAMHAFAVARAMANSCQDLHQFQGQFLEGPWKERNVRQQTEQAMKFLQTQAQGQAVLSKWVDVHKHRLTQPADVLEFVCNIPSQAPKPYVALKIFDNHLASPENFLSQIMAKVRSSSMNSPKIVILWRRRMIESFVSMEIALKSRVWTDADTSNQVVEVKKSRFEWYMNKKKRYYKSIRDQLEFLQVPYQVFEYGRDLLDARSKLETMQRLQLLMNLNNKRPGGGGGGGVSKDSLPEISVRKQSSVPLSNQVSNWDEVVSWGYGGDSNEWEDLFA